jgi:hypothetical protein
MTKASRDGTRNLEKLSVYKKVILLCSLGNLMRMRIILGRLPCEV